MWSAFDIFIKLWTTLITKHHTQNIPNNYRDVISSLLKSYFNGPEFKSSVTDQMHNLDLESSYIYEVVVLFLFLCQFVFEFEIIITKDIKIILI